LRDEGVVFPKFESDAEKKIEELESKIKELEASTNGESVTSENGESKPKASETGKADVMNMSYKEVLEQIPDEKQRKKLVNYVKAKLDASKH
jgi:acetyl-CoA carboxylase alpha subunit